MDQQNSKVVFKGFLVPGVYTASSAYFNKILILGLLGRTFADVIRFQISWH